MIKIERLGEVLLKPNPEHCWESRAVLNPATVRVGDEIYLLYRAVEGENYSAIGFARLDRYGKVLERRSQPVIRRELDEEQRGCEDPRLVFLAGKYYVFYTAYDGTSCRVGVAVTTDFQAFEKLGSIGPDIWDKDAMTFPELVHGQVIYIHRLEPNIQFAYFNSMNHLLHPEKNYWKNYLANLDQFTVMRPQFDWEVSKIGGGAPPIKTPKGWLFIYHGVDKNLTYRAGVALLDLENPATVLARLPYPILEPTRIYEKTGDVNNVVFPEGVVQFDDDLLIYYGAADRVISWGKISLNALLNELEKHLVQLT